MNQKTVEIRKIVAVDRHGKDVSIVVASKMFTSLEAGLRWAYQRINRDPMYWVAVDGKEVLGN